MGTRRIAYGAIEKVKKMSRQAAQNHMPARRLLSGGDTRGTITNKDMDMGSTGSQFRPPIPENFPD